MPDVPVLTARNPRALVEVVLGRPIDWSAVTEPDVLVETVLETPYEELFDPRHGSPVHLGHVLDDGALVRRTPSFASDRDEDPEDEASDLDRYPLIELADVRRVADLKVLAGVAADELPIRRFGPSRAGGWTVEIGPAPAVREATLARLFPPAVLGRLWGDVFPSDLGWNPDGGTWRAPVGAAATPAGAPAPGRIPFDVVQGALADGWLVAALSAVAWAEDPGGKVRRARHSRGAARGCRAHRFELTDPTTGERTAIDLTDELVVWDGTDQPMVATSLWEKAFAMWRAGTGNDHPNLTVLNGGDPVDATAALTGGTPRRHATAGSSAAGVLAFVRAHSRHHRAAVPLTAWTHDSADAAPGPVRFRDANLVASHAYTVLGWATGPQLLRPEVVDVDVLWRLRDSIGPVLSGAGDPVPDYDWRLRQDYVVLRNPWGFHDASAGAIGRAIPLRDLSFWREPDPAATAGVFAIDLPTFVQAFAGLGAAV